MDVLTLIAIIESNIIIKQNEIDRIRDEIEYHNKIISNHYNYSIEMILRYDYLKDKLNKLILEKRAYKLGRNTLLRQGTVMSKNKQLTK